MRSPVQCAFLAYALVFSGCGAASPPSRHAPTPRHRSAHAPASGAPSFADSPLSPFARAATAIALAAAEGRPLPATRLTVAPTSGRSVRIEPGAPPPPFVPLAFLVRIVAVPAGDAATPWTVGLVLGHGGLALFDLEPRAPPAAGRPAAELPALAVAVDHVLATAASPPDPSRTTPATAALLHVGAAVPALPSIAETLGLAAPSAAALGKLRPKLGAHPRAARLTLDAVGLVARGRDGRLAVLDLRPAAGAGPAVLRSDPVVVVAPLASPEPSGEAASPRP